MHGTIIIQQVLWEAQRAREQRDIFIHRMERFVEKEAVKLYGRASDDYERAKVGTLYREAFERLAQRRQGKLPY